MTPERFTIQISDERLAEMVTRIRATAWPDGEGNDDWSMGVERRWLQDMARWWSETYDWRAREAVMNRLDHYRVTIDDQPIHYVLEKGSGSAPRPLILTHGWPWTFWDFAQVIEPLAHPERFGGDADDGFDVIVPSLPGYGFSPLKGDGYGVLDVARMWNLLMTQVLGHDRYIAAGSDWGGIVTTWLGREYPDRVIAVHSTLATAPGLEGLSDADRNAFAPDEQWMVAANEARADTVKSHSVVHSHDPQTLAYALADSPIGTAAWLWERRREWSDCGGDIERAFDRTALCDLASLYWLTNTTGTSFRMYAKRLNGEPIPVPEERPAVTVPTGYAIMPGDTVFRPRSALEKLVDLRRWRVLRRGGHFAYPEAPDLLVRELREFLSELT